METEHNDLPEWRPDELLEQAAARRGFTVEQFRARVRAVADDARKVGGHISFEHARHLDLSDEEFAHVERCRFCTDLLLYIASEVVASVAQAGEVGAQEPEHTGSM